MSNRENTDPGSSQQGLTPLRQPIEDVIPEIKAALLARHELVLEAPPGAGKTTMVPISLLNEPWLQSQKILMLSPRRMAAKAAAERMAFLLGERVGDTIGYRIRLESRVSAQTKVEVVTEGILTRILQDDPSLEGIGLLIFDEFHERNLDSDLGLALTLHGRSMFREEDNPLKLLIMSATLDTSAIAKWLNDAALVSSKGRMFPVDIHYGQTIALRDSIDEPVVSTICQAIEETEGSILVFLPGQAEIKRIENRLSERLAQLGLTSSCIVAPLYGGLSLAQQERAIQPIGAGLRKIVLSTDIAETSLTIDGVSVVVDSGLRREPVFDTPTGMTRLHTKRISQASSVQRMGRAGRLEPGSCYRLWSEHLQSQLVAHSPPEILQADLAPLALQIVRWGIQDLAELSWLDAPPAASYRQALDLLERLGAVAPSSSGNGLFQLTPHGELMAMLPTHPRLAHLLLVGKQIGMDRLAADVAAILSERNVFDRQGVDLSYRLAAYRGEIKLAYSQRSWRERTKKQAQQFARVCDRFPKGSIAISDWEPVIETTALGLLIASAYPDRVGRRRESGLSFQLSGGRAAALRDDCLSNDLRDASWLAIAELGGRVGSADANIFSAAVLDPALFSTHLASMVKTSEIAEWDEKADKFIAESRQKLGNIVASSEPILRASTALKNNALIELVKKRGLTLLPWDESLRQWQARVELMVQFDSSETWPDVSDQWLLHHLDDWLLPYLDDVKRLSDFKKLDLSSILQSLLTWPEQQTLDRLAPLKISVPSGSKLGIDYGQSPPVLSVKLQEMFGCENTPTIANGRVTLLVHLLSPAKRPLQVTQDLAGFWRSSYEDVKKEMKGRYPKHPWPDDPLQALPTRFVKHPKKRT